MKIHERVFVTTDESGLPLAFLWRTTRYVIVSEPELWFEKLPWWRKNGNISTLSQFTLERTMWRVTALPCTGPRSLRSDAPEDAIYDLCALPNGIWLLSEAHTHTLDVTLFA